MRALAAMLFVMILAGGAQASSPELTATGTAMPRAPSYAPVTYAELPGWADDDALAAFRAFLQSCPAVLRVADRPTSPQRQLAAACRDAEAMAAKRVTRRAARAFFEGQFTPHRIVHNGPPGLLTGYYEPVIDGSRVRTDRFKVPVLRRPADLETVVDESQRGAAGAKLTHLRRAPGGGLVPYYTRTEIELGALAGAGLELIWIADEVELFFLQIQGSGRIRLPDGTLFRLGYDGKNGHPYTSIGRYLIDRGEIGADRMSLQALIKWLRADRDRGQAVMRQNASYVFFRELPPAQPSAVGAMNIPLTPGRSLAVDAGLHPLGAPVYVSAPSLRHATPGRSFQRLMIAQDVGSAIKGPERGDLYFGSGDRAGRLAGVTKHEGRLFVLLPGAK